eukprot:SAG31_NODE_2950_length_4870_cov_3.507860_2_plen_204_part_00
MPRRRQTPINCCKVRVVTFSFLCPLLDKYGTFIERCNALIEKVSTFIGSIDFPLNETGASQAKQMGRALAHMPLDVIVSSDTIRTQETAAAVAEYHPSLGPVQLLSGLHEMCFGELEGQRIEDVKSSGIFNEIEAAWSDGDVHRRWPGHGGESAASVAARSLNALQTLLDPPESVASKGASVCPQRLMLVGHDRSGQIIRNCP